MKIRLREVTSFSKYLTVVAILTAFIVGLYAGIHYERNADALAGISPGKQIILSASVAPISHYGSTPVFPR